MIDNPGILPLTIPIGRDFRKRLRIRVNGLYLSLMEYNIKSEIRVSKKRTSDLITAFRVIMAEKIRSDYGIAIVANTFDGTEAEYLTSLGFPGLYNTADDVTGIFFLDLKDTESSSIIATSGYYDALLSKLDGQDDTWVEGKVKFKPLPTRK